MRQFGLAAVALLLLAACNETPANDAEPAAATEEVTTELTDPTLDLQATGIIVPAQNGFEQYDVPFGSNRAATEATLANVVGETTGGGDGKGDCHLQTADYEGLSLAFNEESFVGYYATAPYVPAITRAEMLADPAVSLVTDSTLGDEFTIGTGSNLISGIFTGSGDSDTVESLWAGENCIFR